MPKDQMSAFLGQYGCLDRISGAMYETVPQKLSDFFPREIVPNAKSMSIGWFESSTKILSGFISRCATPISWQYLIADANLCKIVLAMASSNFPSFFNRELRVWPLKYCKIKCD